MKKGQKKGNDRTIFLVAVILFALSVGLFAGAYARFQTTVTGTAALTVADWEFTVNGQSSNFTINLLDGDVNNVITVGNTKKVQPGSSGSYDIVVAATNSDVPVTYTIEIGTTSGLPENLVLCADASCTTTGISSLGGELAAGGTATKTIYWRWLWSTEDVENSYAGTSFNLPIVVTGYQKTPNSPLYNKGA